MNYKIVIRKEAQEDIEEAVVWYKEQKDGLEVAFWDSFKDAILLIQQPPLRHKEVKENFRKISLHVFPYNIYYRISRKNIIVLAVVHQKRHPDIWKKRK